MFILEVILGIHFEVVSGIKFTPVLGVNFGVDFRGQFWDRF